VVSKTVHHLCSKNRPGYSLSSLIFSTNAPFLFIQG